MMSVWTVSILVASFGVIGCFATPEGYGQLDHHHGYNGIAVVPKIVDYYSKPQYAFGYEIDDYYQQLHHGRWEIRDGDVTQGQYRVLLPDGRTQIVSYIADKGGYRPTIQYIGKGEHPPPPPAYAHVKPPKHLHLEPEPIVHNDIYDQGGYGGYGGQAPFSAPGPTPAFIPVKKVVPIVPLAPGPLKLDASPYGFGQIGPTGFGGSGYGAYGAYGAYGQGYGLGGTHYGGDHLAFAPSNQKVVKVSPGRLAKKRALLYDRTLFRRDIPKPLTPPRK